MNNGHLSAKDRIRREQILSGDLSKVMFSLGIPLIVQQCMHHFFNIIDSAMAVNISSNAVSAISYISQLMMVLSAIGGGLSVGASIKISEAHGAGDFEKVKTLVSTLMAFCFILCILILIITVPFSTQIMKLFNTPDSFISIGRGYFIVSVLARVFDFFNLSYQAIERARGNTKLILFFNFKAAIIKLVLTSIFIYVLHTGVVMIAAATLISHITITFTAVKNLNKKNGVFSFSMNAIRFRKEIMVPLLRVFVPISAEKAFFSAGKVFVNSMSTFYGDFAVGAMGITQIITGFMVTPQIGMQGAGATIISQNLGANQPKRALEALKKVFIFNLLSSVVLICIATAIGNKVSIVFSAGDPLFMSMIRKVYYYIVFGTIAMAVSNSTLALIYGTAKTRLAMLLDFGRLFVIRIPMLYYIQHYTNIGYGAVGCSVLISNIIIAVVALIFTVIIVRDTKKNTIKRRM